LFDGDTQQQWVAVWEAFFSLPSVILAVIYQHTASPAPFFFTEW